MQFQYNAAGEVVRAEDAKHQLSLSWYDAEGRVRRRDDLAADGTPAASARWSFDTGTGTTPGVGQLQREEDPVSGYLKTYGYDGQGRAARSQTVIGGNAYMKHTGSGLTFDA